MSEKFVISNPGEFGVGLRRPDLDLEVDLMAGKSVEVTVGQALALKPVLEDLGLQLEITNVDDEAAEKSRLEAENKSKLEAEAKAKADADKKAADEKARKDKEAADKAKADLEAKAKQEAEAKAAADKLTAEKSKEGQSENPPAPGPETK